MITTMATVIIIIGLINFVLTILFPDQDRHTEKCYCIQCEDID